MVAYNELLYSILSMDVYHRDNNQGVFHPNPGANDDTNGISVSDYKIIASEVSTDKSFYAVAYKHAVTGEIVISYRGTDAFKIGAPNDIFGGWTTGAGVIYPSQLPDAIAFYERVVSQQCASRRRVHSPLGMHHPSAKAQAQVVSAIGHHAGQSF
jgi:hypothetical protein